MKIIKLDGRHVRTFAFTDDVVWKYAMQFSNTWLGAAQASKWHDLFVEFYGIPRFWDHKSFRYHYNKDYYFCMKRLRIYYQDPRAITAMMLKANYREYQ